ncbi:internal virion lysozyme motif [Klebsiella phage vB_Kpn_K15PH90]|uniref:Internal virion lysozyme motif n=1 Tax=Klebsiella phage vB_Kpn_K15PH90 TaxID=3071635 RepID=A0AAV1MMD8_9CAUD|nr:internal virion lysozyme motif [Klebsiella phage vB_Kpn_K15PH90]
MPVIQPSRQGLNIGGVQLQSNDVSLPSTVSEVSVDTSKAKRLAALSGFVQDFGVGFDEAVKENAAAATVRGAMDAQGAVDAMASKDEAVQKQNIFVREAYQDGYVSAAAYDSLAKWRTDSIARAKKAAESGLTDEEFQQQEQEHVQSMSDKLGMYLPDMSKQSATTILQQLRATSMANYTAFQKGRAAFAMAQADRALDRGLSSSSDEFYQRLQAGQGAAAQMSIKTGLDSILAAEHLDKSKKLDRAKQYMVSVAQQTQDPMVINQLQELATKELGVNSVDVNAALYQEFKRAGAQIETQARFEISDAISSLEGQTPEQQEQTMARIRSRVIELSASDVLSAGTSMEFWNKAQTIREKAADTQALRTAITGNMPSSTLAGMFKGDLDKARTQLLKSFPDTPEGNLQLLAYGSNSKDAWAVNEAHKRMSSDMARTLTTLDQLGEDGEVSRENVNSINLWAQAYSTSTDLGKMALLSEVPSEWQGVVQKAIAQNPSNASNTILDDLRRQARNKASGRYSNIQSNPTDKMVDPSGTSNWFSFFGDADAQRQEARAAMEEEYRYTYSRNPESLVGKDAEDINTMLKGNIQARKLELEIAGTPRHVYLPAGTSLQSIMGDYKGDQEQFKATLQQQIQNQVQAITDPSNMERVVVQAATAGNAGQNMTVTVFDKKGTFQTMSVNLRDVQATAQAAYDSALAGEMKIGSEQVGVRPATFYDHDNGRAVSVQVNGRNSVGLEPSLFSDILATTMKFEGFREGKGKGSVGFGLHINSGMPVPQKVTLDDGISILKSSMENQYVPNVQKQLKGQGLNASDEALKVMVDLNYHGGNGSSGPVAEAMAQVRKAAKSPVGAYQYPVSEAQGRAWQALRNTPAYKQAQPERKKYLEQNLRDWLFEATH